MAQATQTLRSVVRACECTTSLKPNRSYHKPFNVVRVACTYLRRHIPKLFSMWTIMHAWLNGLLPGVNVVAIG